MAGLSIYTFTNFLDASTPSTAVAYADSRENAIRILVAEFVKNSAQYKLYRTYQQDFNKATSKLDRDTTMAIHALTILRIDQKRSANPEEYVTAISQAQNDIIQAKTAYDNFVRKYTAANPEPVRPRSSMGGYFAITANQFESLLLEAHCEAVLPFQWSGVYMVGDQ